MLLCQRPNIAAQDEMTRYHSDEYIRFLRNIRPDNVHDYTKLMQRCKSVYSNINFVVPVMLTVHNGSFSSAAATF